MEANKIRFIAAKWFAPFVGMLVSTAAIHPLSAHPMPDTEIEVRRSANTTRFLVRLPLTELLLALPAIGVDRDGVLTGKEQEALRAYFVSHTRISSGRGRVLPVSINSLQLLSSAHDDVGAYRELLVETSVSTESSLPLSLAYDGIIHHVGNHRAFVRYASGAPIGVISYSLAKKRTNSILIAPFSAKSDMQRSLTNFEEKPVRNLQAIVYTALFLVFLVSVLLLGVHLRRR